MEKKRRLNSWFVSILVLAVIIALVLFAFLKEEIPPEMEIDQINEPAVQEQASIDSAETKIEVVKCVDSDGGKDLMISGGTAKENVAEEDKCSGVYNVVEYFCENNEVSSIIGTCPTNFECKEGACIKTVPAENNNLLEELCSDSDNGKFYEIIGETKKGENVKKDVCDGTNIIEYYCEDNTVKSENVPCGSGKVCKEGVCVEKKLEIVVPFECTDSDQGKDYLIKGTTYEKTPQGESTNVDTCVNGKLREYYCSIQSTMLQEEVSCDLGFVCEEGACKLFVPEIDLCKDSDGGKDYFTKGTISKGDSQEVDGCFFDSVIEFYCNANNIANEYHNCDSGYKCEEGACKFQMFLPSSTCSDSDGGKNYVKRGITKKSFTIKEDYCFFDTLYEYYCQDNTIKEEMKICNCNMGECI